MSESLLGKLKRHVSESKAGRENWRSMLGPRKQEMAKKMPSKNRLSKHEVEERKKRILGHKDNSKHESPVSYQNRVGRAYND